MRITRESQRRVQPPERPATRGWSRKGVQPSQAKDEFRKGISVGRMPGKLKTEREGLGVNDVGLSDRINDRAFADAAAV